MFSVSFVQTYLFSGPEAIELLSFKAFFNEETWVVWDYYLSFLIRIHKKNLTASMDKKITQTDYGNL